MAKNIQPKEDLTNISILNIDITQGMSNVITATKFSREKLQGLIMKGQNIWVKKGIRVTIALKLLKVNIHKSSHQEKAWYM